MSIATVIMDDPVRLCLSIRFRKADEVGERGSCRFCGLLRNMQLHPRWRYACDEAMA